jgi:hypothetical protein
MTIERISHAEFVRRLELQGMSREHLAMVCPICGTIQSMASLIKAGAAPEKVAEYFGSSCEGRFSRAGPWLSESATTEKAKQRRLVRSCDWTLGGLLHLHRLEVMTGDGPRPCFELATPEQARELEALMATGRQPMPDYSGMNLRSFPGYIGLHSRDEAPGAIPNGTKVRKVASKPDDIHQDGALATVLGSIHYPKVGFGYYVEWDSHPRIAVFVAGHRVVRHDL